MKITDGNHQEIFDDLVSFYRSRIKKEVDGIGLKTGRGAGGTGAKELSRRLGFSETYISVNLPRANIVTLKKIVDKIIKGS